MRWLTHAICCCLITGCSLSDTETLEARLRLREDRIADLERRLEEAERETNFAQRESRTLRSRLGDSTFPRSEQLAAGFAVEKLEIHDLLSGLMRDGHIHLVIRPTDTDGDPIKLPGALDVRVLDLGTEEPRQIAEWSWTADEARDLWTGAAIGTGYAVDLPTVEIPTTDSIVVQTKFRVADGREFTAALPISREEIQQADFSGNGDADIIHADAEFDDLSP